MNGSFCRAASQRCLAEVAFQISFGEKQEGQPLGVPWNVLADDLGESLKLAKPQFPPGMIILRQETP